MHMEIIINQNLQTEENSENEERVFSMSQAKKQPFGKWIYASTTKNTSRYCTSDNYDLILGNFVNSWSGCHELV